jgi:glycine betaine/proline transport system substrate-binding protein
MAVTALIMFSAISAEAQEKTIKIGALPWQDTYSLSLITKKFHEKEGYKVEITKFSEWAIAYAATSKGDVDLLMAIPNYNTSDHWARYKSRLEKISPVSFGLYQGFVVPSYMKVDSIDELNSVADSVGGKIIGIEAGSGLMRDVANAIKAYGLKYQLVEGSTAAMTAQLQSSIERKEPIVTMLWTPSWMVQKFDVKYLKDPKAVMPPLDTYYWLAKKGFSKEDEHAREVVASVYVPVADIMAISAEMNDGKTNEQAVDDWWKAHTDLIDRWSVMSSK